MSRESCRPGAADLHDEANNTDYNYYYLVGTNNEGEQ